MIKAKAYVQGANGEEFVCEVTTPEPTNLILDKCVFIPREALEAMLAQPENDYYWVRVVSDTLPTPARHATTSPRPYREHKWGNVITYLKAHPEGVAGGDVQKLINVWQWQNSPALLKRLFDQGLRLEGTIIPGKPGKPKMYKLKEIGK